MEVTKKEGVIVQAEVEEERRALPPAGSVIFAYFGHFKVVFPGTTREVRKVWADGELVYDADRPRGKAGSLKISGPGVVEFEGLPLAPFGNRIPQVAAEFGGRRTARLRRVGTIDEVAGWEVRPRGGRD